MHKTKITKSLIQIPTHICILAHKKALTKFLILLINMSYKFLFVMRMFEMSSKYFKMKGKWKGMKNRARRVSKPDYLVQLPNVSATNLILTVQCRTLTGSRIYVIGVISIYFNRLTSRVPI